jgi:annexin A7/11
MSKKVDPKHAATALYDAMKGFGTNEKKIIDTLAGLDTETIQLIREEFQNQYHKDLIKEIKSETSGNFERALVGLLQHPVEYDAWLIHDAIEGVGTNDQQLIEVLISRHPDHIKKVSAFFQQQYGTSMEEYIAGDTSGDYKDYLLALAGGHRDSNTLPVDDEKAEADTEKLYRAGEGTLGTDEKVFIDVFSKRSWKHIRKVADDYAKRYKHSLHTALDKEFNGDIFHALEWSLEFVENKQAYFAKRLHHAFAGLGTHDKELVRIIISRNNVDLYEIAGEYNTIYGKSLKEALHSEISGDYRTLIERLLSANE